MGAAIAIALVGALDSFTQAALLAAPFGSTCILLFLVHESPLSQPLIVVAGHTLTALIGVVAYAILPDTWWALALVVGFTIPAMAVLRIIHPPAGANPIIVFQTDPGFGFVIFPVLVGTMILVAVATIYHRGTGTGEVMSNIDFGFGALGTVTNGSVRDLPDCAEGFQFLAGSVSPSHAYVHLVDWGGEVEVNGMTVRDGDIVHADQHGAVVVPRRCRPRHSRRMRENRPPGEVLD